MDIGLRIELKKAHRMVSIVGFAAVGMMFMFAFMVEAVRFYGNPFFGSATVDVINNVRYAMLGIAFANFFFIKFLNNAILFWGKNKSADAERGLFSLPVQKLFAASVVTYMMCEFMALLGMIMYFVSGATYDFYLFFSIGLFYFGLFFPRMERWDKWVDAMTD